MAGSEVTWRFFLQKGETPVAFTGNGIRTARVKGAAGRWGERAGNVSLQDNPTFSRDFFDIGDRGNKGLRVGMHEAVENIPGLSHFHYRTQIHDGDSFAYMSEH